MSVATSVAGSAPVTLITHEFYPRRGGIATFAEEIARASADLGHEVEVWAQAAPTTYTIFKTIPTPTIKFWQLPDDSATYTAHVRMLSQVQDASQVSGASLDLPYTYLDVYVAGLAHRLSRIYAPDKEQMRKQDYMEALAAAQNTDTQDSTSIYIQPAFSSYYR